VRSATRRSSGSGERVARRSGAPIQGLKSCRGGSFCADARRCGVGIGLVWPPGCPCRGWVAGQRGARHRGAPLPSLQVSWKAEATFESWELLDCRELRIGEIVRVAAVGKLEAAHIEFRRKSACEPGGSVASGLVAIEQEHQTSETAQEGALSAGEMDPEQGHSREPELVQTHDTPRAFHEEANV